MFRIHVSCGRTASLSVAVVFITTILAFILVWKQLPKYILLRPERLLKWPNVISEPLQNRHEHHYHHLTQQRASKKLNLDFEILSADETTKSKAYAKLLQKYKHERKALSGNRDVRLLLERNRQGKNPAVFRMTSSFLTRGHERLPLKSMWSHSEGVADSRREKLGMSGEVTYPYGLDMQDDTVQQNQDIQQEIDQIESVKDITNQHENSASERAEDSMSDKVEKEAVEVKLDSEVPVSTSLEEKPLIFQDINLHQTSNGPDFVKNPCIPNLLVIGAQKGGTTSWHMYLKNGIHPNLIVPQGYKECDYFNKLIERGVPLAKYLSEFPGFNNDLDSVHGRCGFNYDSEGSPYIRAEASPNYMPHPRAAIRARETLPDARIIVMLRDPIARLVSAFNMKWQESVCHEDAWRMPDCYKLIMNETNTLESLQESWQNGLRAQVNRELLELSQCLPAEWPSDEALALDMHLDASNQVDHVVRCLGLDTLDSIQLWHKLEDHSHIYRSMYSFHLEQWMRAYPSSSFLIWSSEEFEVDPQRHMREMVDWLNLDPAKARFDRLSTKHHQRKYISQIPSDVRMQLVRFFKPLNEQLFAFLAERGFSETVQQLQWHFQ